MTELKIYVTIDLMGKDNRVLTIHVTEDQYQKLRAISYYSAKSVTKIVRDIIEQLPARKEYPEKVSLSE